MVGEGKRRAQGTELALQNALESPHMLDSYLGWLQTIRARIHRLGLQRQEVAMKVSIEYCGQ